MPTPSDPEPIHSPLPSDASPSHSTFASCPPEEERSFVGPLQSLWPPAAASHAFQRDHEPPTSESDTSVAGAENARDTPSDAQNNKDERADTTNIVMTDAPTPSVESPDAPSESDARLAHSMSTAAISSSSIPESEHMSFPLPRQRLLTNATSSFLRPGSKFRGTQQSDRQKYDVQVEIKDVDMSESFLCGYLRIQGLTDDHPTLTTFFEGEIIGPKYLFRTTHPSWGSSEKVDFQHWARFPAWRPLAKAAKSSSFTLNNFEQREHLFMRWKEYFLVPDHRVKTITGASFEGFYYICFNQCTGTVSGIYFHAKSEKFQQLELQHVDDKGCMGAVEFR